MHPSDTRPQCHVARTAEGVVTVRFDNGRLNLLTGDAAHIYADTLQELAADETTKLLVIRGGDSAFLGGADIKFLKDASRRDIDAYIRSVWRLCETIRDIPFATMSVMPITSNTARIGPPAMMPVPLGAGAIITFAAP